MKQILVIAMLFCALVTSALAQTVTATAVETQTTTVATASGVTVGTVSVAPGLVKKPWPADPNAPDIRRYEGTYDCNGKAQIVFIMRSGWGFGEIHGEQVKQAIIAKLLRPGETLLTHPSGYWYVPGGVITPPVAVAAGQLTTGTQVHGSQVITTTASGTVPATAGAPMSAGAFTLEEHDYPGLGKIWFFNGPNGKAKGQSSVAACQPYANGMRVSVISDGPGTGLVYAQ